ncbi:HflK protein, partial [Pseudomonas sp. Dout3]|nr:HflK protein [Pseudomonas sp. Dout3]
YKVQPEEQGIVLRFGSWQQTAESGLHYHLPFPIETVLLPKITQVNQLQQGSGSSQSAASNGASDKQMLTGHENIVEA